MKTHTFTFSGKGLAAVGAACTTGGLLMFSLGFAIGTVANGPVAERLRESHEAATTHQSPAATVATADPATWPFGSSETPAVESESPAQPGSAAEPEGAPAKPAPASRERATMRNGLTSVAYVEQNDDPADAGDTNTWLVQVGSFRSERNATLLASRLVSAGYHPTITTRDDDGRPLHVVRVARIVGRARAEHVAERIGDAERLVATVVPDRN